MKNQNINQEDASWLRQKAEEQLNRRKSETKKIVSETDMMKLIHELEVHQIELELQNKELVIAKEKAERAEEKYTELYDFAPSGYFTLSQQGNILEMNLHGAQMLGKERQTLLNNKLTLFIGKNTRTVFNDFLSQVFMGKSLASCEVSFVSGSKSPVYVIINGTLADDGKRCMISVMDITESRQAVEALRKSDDRLRTARDAMLDSFLIFSAERDEQGNITDFIFTEMNANAEKMLQLSGKQLIGKRMCEELPINRTNGFFEKYRNVVETGIPLEEEFYLPDTHIPAAWYYHQVVRCDDGIVISHRDITRRKLMEKTLRENEERLRLALKATNDVVWDWDIVHDSQRWNEAGEKVFGWTEIVKNAVNAAWWMERIHPDDRQRVEDGFNL
jgi:PAS domain S-box-containing protein